MAIILSYYIARFLSSGLYSILKELAYNCLKSYLILLCLYILLTSYCTILFAILFDSCMTCMYCYLSVVIIMYFKVCFVI